jgi:hypothetical protein
MDERTSFTAAEWYFGGALDTRTRCECAIFTVEKTRYEKPCIKWNLDAGKKVKRYKLDAHSSDAESLDEDSSDEDSSDEVFSDEDSSDEDDSDEDSSSEEFSGAGFSDEDTSDAKQQRTQRCAARSAEKRKHKKIDRVLKVDRIKSQLISSICSYLELPRDKCKKLGTCLGLVLRALESDKTSNRARALGVLWLGAGFMVIDSKDVDRLVKICKKVVASGREDEIFWATCLLSSMLSWPSVHKGSPPAHREEVLELATGGVCVLLGTDEWPKYVFLAKYLVVKESRVMKSACILFLVTFLKLEGIDDLPDDDDSFFRSKYYRRSHPIKEKKLKQWCMQRLGCLWSENKSVITTVKGGVEVLKAMLKNNRLSVDIKSDIKQVLQSTAKKLVGEVSTSMSQNAAP